MHPLSGADLRTLSLVRRDAGPLSPRGARAFAAARRAALGRLPFTLAERALVAARAPRLEDMPPPVFILGHWRSGTTHLYQLMVEAGFGFVPPVATGLPWDMLILGRLARRQIEARLPADRWIDKVPVKPDSPQEDEIALANMSPLSFYHGIYFPARLRRHVDAGIFLDGADPAEVARWQATFRYFLRKLSLHQGGRRLLIKNPVYTARLAMLAEMLPQATFIHIYRNPLDVLRSKRNFWGKLLQQFALQPFDLAGIDELIVSTYRRMMERLVADAATLPPERFAQMRYEDFMARPLPMLEAAWTQLRLGPFEPHRAAFERYLAGQAAFEPNRFRRDDDAAAVARAGLGEWFERWGYPLPA
jgi:hypothetical protein